MATVTIASVRGLRSWSIYRLFDNFSVVMMVVDNFRLWNRCRWLDIALSSLDAVVMNYLGVWSRTRDSMAHGVNLASCSDMHFWANIHSRAHMAGGALITGRAGTHSGKGWSRMTTVGCMWTEVANLTSLTTSKARRATRTAITTMATIAIGGVSSGRSMAITLVSKASLATMVAVIHRTTTITSASRVSRLGSNVAKMIYLAAMTTLITI